MWTPISEWTGLPAPRSTFGPVVRYRTENVVAGGADGEEKDLWLRDFVSLYRVASLTK